ncbi:hypothetical protein ACFZB6_31085 [Streptomyces syringium]|uniref:hypothetical protein n=1 Tax=Streptomyces syringium TaxID=76729 RepID=UPI0036E6FAA9
MTRPSSNGPRPPAGRGPAALTPGLRHLLAVNGIPPEVVGRTFATVRPLAGRGPAVRGVLLVRLVINRGLAELPHHLRDTPFPPGSLIRIDAGDAHDYLDCWGELAALVRDCADVEVIGTDSRGVAAVCNAAVGPPQAGRVARC